MTAPGAARTGELACPSCTHPWTAHGRDGCAYAEPGTGCWCGNTGAASQPATSSASARLLLEQALHLCQHGERAPGCGPWPAETWPEWARRAEAWLRAEPAREPLDVDGLVTVAGQEIENAVTDVLMPHHYSEWDDGAELGQVLSQVMGPVRAALSSVAADLYERGREDGRGDLIWHEERVRRECAEGLRLHVRRLTSALVAVSNHLDQPYPDDPRWTPWTRFVEPKVDALRVLVDRWSTDPDQDTEGAAH